MKIKYLKFVAILIFSFSTYSQVTVSVQDLQYTNNGQPAIYPTNCGNIDLASSTSTSISFGINLSKPNGQVVGLSDLRVYTQKSSSDSRIERSWTQIQESFWSTSVPNTYLTTASFSINSSDFNATGGTLFVVFKSSGNVEYQTACSFTITKTPPPTFTLSPTSLNLVCGDTSAKTFAVTPANIPAGANVTYQWNFSGWNGTASSTMSSVSLTPNSGTSLPSTVSVTPFINGVAKPTMSCVVSRATFNPSSVITGNLNLCPSSTSTYTLTNLSSNSVSWNSSNSSVASIGLASGSSVSVNGISNGSVVLTATITNSCGQTATKTFNINIGTANISNHTILGGNNNVSQGSVSLLNVTPAVGATSYIWSVIPMYSGGCSSTLPYILSNGSQTSQIVYWGGCTGMYRVRCLMVNPCGSRYYSDKVVNVFNSIENPCSSARLVVSPNPIKNGNDILLNIIDYPDLPPCDDALFRQISGVKIFNLDSKLVFSNNYDNQKEVRISNLNLDKGYYIIHLTTANKHILKENILIE